MIHLFTYGSLMVEDIMVHVAAAHFPSTRAILHDHFRSGIRSEQYPAVVERAGCSVEGTLYCDVNGTALARLDLFEGEMYERKSVEVRQSDGGRRQAMTYIFKADYYHLLTWEPWSLDSFLSSGKDDFIKRYFGFREIG